MFGLQIHVYEIVKVAMVMYLAWALHAYKQDSKAMEEGQESPTFGLANRLAEYEKLKFLKNPFWKRCMYIYGPTLIVCGMTAAGSNSSAIFVFLVLIGTMLIGGAPFKELFMAGAAVLVMAMCLFGIHKATDGKFMHRMETFTSRMNASYETDRLDRYKLESREFYSARDSIKQPYGAKLAVHEGKLLGKGSGNSTQRYSVTHIYSDYMFSFLVEEYGLIGGIIILTLYLSL